MKTRITFVLVLALATVYGCHSSSPRGGGMTKDVGFKITVPTLGKNIKQGQTQNITVSLKRGDRFKHDVTLQMEAATGISVDPTSVTIKASDTPDVQLRIAAAQNAALGEYSVSLKGIPTTGEPTSTAFTVKVVAR